MNKPAPPSAAPAAAPLSPRALRALGLFLLAAYGLIPSLLFLTALRTLLGPEANSSEKAAAALMLLVSLAAYGYVARQAAKLFRQARQNPSQRDPSRQNPSRRTNAARPGRRPS